MENPKRRFASDIIYGDGWAEEGLGAMARKNPEQFMTRAQGLIDKGELRLGNVTSLRHLFDQLWDVEVNHTAVDPLGQKRTITSNAFPLMTGGLVAAEVNLGLEGVAAIGDQLVTEMDDNKKWTHMAAVVVTAPSQDRVDELEPFPEIGAGEERYDIGHKRNGFKMSITAEAIEENEIPQIVDRANQLGEIVGERVETQTLRRVCDIDGSGTSPAEPYVLRINGAGTSLYTTVNTTLTRLSSSGNRITNNALTDETDLENAFTRLSSFTNERGERVSIPVSQMVLLVPHAKVYTANKIRGSVMAPGVENEKNNWGPEGMFQPRVVFSAKLDDLSTSAWYLGDFARQFKRKWKLRFENASLGGSAQQMWLDRRIAAQFRIAYDMEVGSVGFQRVVQNLDGTTAP